MDMSKKDYKKFVEKKSPNSPLAANMVKAFISGGLICVIGEVILNGYTSLGLTPDGAGAATSVTLVFAGALLTGLKVYDNLAKFSGAGTLVPITGFANSVAAPALEFKSEGLITGMSAKMFIIAGPVIVFGTMASVLYGLFYFLVKLAQGA
ncbi:stage V sporulation protein AC [Oscillospiraceae bacterium CM]|nr:stage V sporulation protein AC [Oscillospiraceae bacterium CM]